MLTEKEKQEIEELRNDPFVKLANKELYKKHTVDKDKKRLYQLRWLKKYGQKIAKQEE